MDERMRGRESKKREMFLRVIVLLSLSLSLSSPSSFFISLPSAVTLH